MNSWIKITKKVSATLNYIEHFPILGSTTAASASISFFISFIGIL